MMLSQWLWRNIAFLFSVYLWGCLKKYFDNISFRPQISLKFTSCVNLSADMTDILLSLHGVLFCRNLDYFWTIWRPKELTVVSLSVIIIWRRTLGKTALFRKAALQKKLQLIYEYWIWTESGLLRNNMRKHTFNHSPLLLVSQCANLEFICSRHTLLFKIDHISFRRPLKSSAYVRTLKIWLRLITQTHNVTNLRHYRGHILHT